MSPRRVDEPLGRRAWCSEPATGEYRVNQIRAITVACLLAATVLPAVAVEISGAGATFPYPLYAKWADTYRKETGIGLNYQSIGSGGGIKQIEAKTVTFGATDAPLKREDLGKFGLVQFPMVMGGMSPDWKSQVGTNTSVEWPIGIGAKGNEGVSNNVSQAKGSIGYVEYAYARQNKMDLYEDGQQGWQDRRAHRRGFPSGRRQCGLEFGAGLWTDSSQSAEH